MTPRRKKEKKNNQEKSRKILTKPLSFSLTKMISTLTSNNYGFKKCKTSVTNFKYSLDGDKMTPIRQPIYIILSLSQPFFRDFLRILREEEDFRVFDVPHSLNQIEDIPSLEKIDVVIVEVRELQDLLGIRRLIKKRKALKVVVMGDDKNIALEYMKAGAKGYISHNISPDLLKKTIRVIHKGQVWIDRKTVSEVFEDFARLAPERWQSEIMKTLSNREREVIRLVAQGCNNSDIALSLFISKNTVKTHLRRIFEKIGVHDRLKAALLVTNSKEL